MSSLLIVQLYRYTLYSTALFQFQFKLTELSDVTGWSVVVGGVVKDRKLLETSNLNSRFLSVMLIC